jgi:transposase
MLQFAPGVKVYLACKPVDMRRGFDGLAADVAQTLHADPYLCIGRDYVAAAA